MLNLRDIGFTITRSSHLSKLVFGVLPSWDLCKLSLAYLQIFYALPSYRSVDCVPMTPTMSPIMLSLDVLTYYVWICINNFAS